ncbi:MAG: PEGA domain-containing protein [Prevotella sp.]|nr:PEGA domain-containing protein [Prevotella sp.]MCM1437169.1 PEGA domain-containing protein [Prevotella sp.]
MICVFSVQALNVKSFELRKYDKSAERAGVKNNARGDMAALIKIPTNEKGFSFDVGYQEVLRVEEQSATHPGEIWLFVPAGVKRISITHPRLGKISKYDMGMTLQPGATYLLKLEGTTSAYSSALANSNATQKLIAHLTPAESHVEINGRVYNSDGEGTVEVELPLGSYEYTVTADKFHPEQGTVEHLNADLPTELNVILRPAFGYISFMAAPQYDGANVYVDDNYVGKLPLNDLAVESGDHEVKISKDLYRPFSQTVTVTDNGFYTVTPMLDDNFAFVQVTVPGDQDADIYDNGRLIGRGRWQGQLASGHHIFEARKEGHTTTMKTEELETGHRVSVALRAPQPKYGQIYVVSFPENADVYIDGKKVGKTPLSAYSALEGGHDVEVRRKGFKRDSQRVDVREGEVTTHNVVLTDECEVNIASSPSGASLYIDGNYVGNTPYTASLGTGSYKLLLTSHGRSKFNKTISVNAEKDADYKFNLHRDLIHDNEFYFLAGYSFINSDYWNFGGGFYLGKVNIEGNYLLGKTQEDLRGVSDLRVQGWNVKVGYGIRLSGRFRLTPQAGVQQFIFKPKDNYYYDYGYDYGYSMVEDTSFKALSATVGLRFNVALCQSIGIGITPEYAFRISDDKGFSSVSEEFSEIDNLTKGFRVNAAINIWF